jgi:hypothetical protein
MKKIFIGIFAISFVLFHYSCSDIGKKSGVSIKGPYKMLSMKIQGESMDTTITTREQLKIFTGEFLMYSNYNPVDSTSSFGIGEYTIDADTITENILFTAVDSSRNNNPGTYSLIINKTPEGYIQIIPKIETQQGQVYKLTEEYVSTGSTEKSPLDGAWVLVSRYIATGKDTLVLPAYHQYKVYHGGQFMWGNSYDDSIGKKHTAIGFGDFYKTGKNMIKESGKTSTLSNVRGHDFDINYSLTGKDRYEQLITNADSTISGEIYVRLKKGKEH